jgi:predicted nucleic acid-binding protein
MKLIHVLDANALTALFEDEDGASFIEELLESAKNGLINIYLHRINLIEVLYHAYRQKGGNEVTRVYNDFKSLPISLIDDMSDDLMLEASRLKGSYKMSLADAIGLATAIIYNGYFVTADYHEIEPIQKAENLNIVWFRDKG